MPIKLFVCTFDAIVSMCLVDSYSFQSSELLADLCIILRVDTVLLQGLLSAHLPSEMKIKVETNLLLAKYYKHPIPATKAKTLHNNSWGQNILFKGVP